MTAHGPMDFPEAREALVDAGQRLAARRLVSGTSGNLSVRVGDRIVTTPSGVPLDSLDPARLSLIDLDGTHLSGAVPTSEVPLHLALYRNTGAGAIAHTHAAVSTAVSCTCDELPALHERLVRLGLIAPLDSVRDVVRAAYVSRLILSQPVGSRVLLACAQAASGNLAGLRLEWQELQNLQMRVHPVSFADFGDIKYSRSLAQLGRALGSSAERITWSELRSLRTSLEADVTSVVTSYGLARQFCDLIGSKATGAVSQLRSILSIHDNLRVLGSALPLAWWRQPSPQCAA